MNSSINSPSVLTNLLETTYIMTLKGKHNVAEIDGVRCTVVETGATKERLEFLKALLSHNGYEVKTEQEKDKEGTMLDKFLIGVTDILFNPVISLYQKKLFREDGHEVTAAYWEQKPADTKIPYWQV